MEVTNDVITTLNAAISKDKKQLIDGDIPVIGYNDRKVFLEEILDLFPDKETKGNISFKYISGIASLESADRGDLTFLSNLKYKKQIHQTKASVILLPTGVEFEPRAEQLGIWIENPSLAITKLCSFLESRLLPKAKAGIHPTAFIEDTAFVDESAHIGPFCYIGVGAHVGKNTIIESHCHVGKDVIIKQNCRLFPSVKILSLCLIEDRVVINSGVVVGSDGYGFDQVDVGEHRKIPHLGKVIIENDVEIGANTTIDRARIEETRIGEGTKIDNLVQIGHNVRIGKGCLIVAQVGIAGSTNGRFCNCRRASRIFWTFKCWQRSKNCRAIWYNKRCSAVHI